MLRETKYCQEEITFLEKGLTEGFDIGYEGPQNRRSTSQNIPFTVGNKTILWNKIMKEVQLKRVAGPYKECDIPFNNYIQSPVGLVPKAGSDQTRLIFHLSFDCKEDGQKSVNNCTPRDKCTVHYRDIDYAVNAYAKVCESDQPANDKDNLKQKWRRNFENHKRIQRVVYAGKSDLKSAFCLLGLSRDSYKWLVMKAPGPNYW